MNSVYSRGRVGMVALSALALALALLPVMASAAIDHQLDSGDRGEEVRELQTWLALDSSLYPEGLVTGYYGTLTTAAAERLQCREDIVCSGTAATTGYGRVGPKTLSRINALMALGGTGGSDDEHAPIMSTETVSTTQTSATINWTTSEDATSRVMYGTGWPFLYSVAPSAIDASHDTNTTVVITGLEPNRTYYYVRESVDISGNVMWDVPHTFTTK